ncbi:MAG: hypothetical protein ACE5F9_00960 [Phycisphaerae bacterium]
MAIQFACTACGQPIEVDDELADQVVTCPFCRKTVTAPSQSNLAPGPHPAPSESTPAMPYAPQDPVAAAVPAGTNRFSWIALGCVGVSIVCMIVLSVVVGSIMQDIGPIDDPKELSSRLKEEIQGNSAAPILSLISILGACAFPLAGVVFAVVALARRTPPRWPAITALCLVGGLVLLLCISTFLTVSAGGMNPPGS